MLPLIVFKEVPKNAYDLDLHYAIVVGFYGPGTLLKIKVIRFEKSFSTNSLRNDGKFIINLCI